MKIRRRHLNFFGINFRRCESGSGLLRQKGIVEFFYFGGGGVNLMNFNQKKKINSNH